MKKVELLYNEYQINLEKVKAEFKKEYTKKYKQNEKQMNQYWKDRFQIYIENKCKKIKKIF